MKGSHLDISSGENLPTVPTAGETHGSGRPFLGVKFECCGVYARIYRNRQQDAYDGCCPRCARPIRFQIGPGGESARFFSVS